VKYCKQGGARPAIHNGLRKYSDEVYSCHRAVLKESLQKKPTALIVDETTDATASRVLNITAVILEPAKKGKPGSLPLPFDTKFVTSVNSTTVGQAIVQTVVDYGIRYEDLQFVMCDNAPYMTKCIREVLKPLSNGTCWAVGTYPEFGWFTLGRCFCKCEFFCRAFLFIHRLASVDIMLRMGNV